MNRMSSPKILKVMYFDNNSAGDYLNIIHEGVKSSKTEKENKKETFTNINFSAKFHLITLLVALLGTVSAVINSNIIVKLISLLVSVLSNSANFIPLGIEFLNQRKKSNKKLIRTEIRSSVLTDFIDKVGKENKDIIHINDYSIKIEQASFAFIKHYSPYINSLGFKHEGIDISKFFEVMANTKGYYEVLAEKKTDEGKVVRKIFRLNADSFRNNYKLTDILKMNLEYYGIKVGKMELKDINFNSVLQINSEETKDIIDIKNNLENSNDIDKTNNKKLEVIDIILICIHSHD